MRIRTLYIAKYLNELRNKERINALATADSRIYVFGDEIKHLGNFKLEVRSYRD